MLISARSCVQSRGLACATTRSTTTCSLRSFGKFRQFPCQRQRTYSNITQSRQCPELLRRRSVEAPQNYRHFSATQHHRATSVKVNLRKDENGDDMMVDITPRAANRLREIMIQDSNPSLALRVTVQSGGCHGFQYLMSLASIDDASPEDDTIFEAEDGSGAKVIMDEPSLELLKGSQVDYTMELIGSQFKIVGNPAASSSCGCGTSFDIKT